MDNGQSMPFEADQKIVAHCRYYTGNLGEIFYDAIEKEQKILGVRCKTCEKVLWPPRSTCGKCFGQMNGSDLVEIGPGGTLETFTQVHYEGAIHPYSAPLIYGIVKLDGADCGTAHLIAEVEFHQLEVGMRMVPVFKDEPTGTILDIAHFKPE